MVMLDYIRHIVKVFQAYVHGGEDDEKKKKIQKILSYNNYQHIYTLVNDIKIFRNNVAHQQWLYDISSKTVYPPLMTQKEINKQFYPEKKKEVLLSKKYVLNVKKSIVKS